LADRVGAQLVERRPNLTASGHHLTAIRGFNCQPPVAAVRHATSSSLSSMGWPPTDSRPGDVASRASIPAFYGLVDRLAASFTVMDSWNGNMPSAALHGFAPRGETRLRGLDRLPWATNQLCDLCSSGGTRGRLERVPIARARHIVSYVEPVEAESVVLDREHRHS
jgi:hypothetical protein